MAQSETSDRLAAVLGPSRLRRPDGQVGGDHSARLDGRPGLDDPPWPDGRAGFDDPPSNDAPGWPEPEPEPAGVRSEGRSRWVPAGLRGARLDPGRRGAWALAVIAVAAAVLAAVGVWTGRPQIEPVSALPAVTVSAPASGRSGEPDPPPSADPPPSEVPAAAPAALVVSVSGKVHRPGLVEVPDGARVADVIEAAGGALAGTDLTSLNLARKVVDGEQIAVGVPAAPEAADPAGPDASPAGADAPAGRVDLNTATADQLDSLPGVGPVTVARILEWRTRNGRFAKVEQLREIDGIGERRFGRLRELVTV